MSRHSRHRMRDRRQRVERFLHDLWATTPDDRWSDASQQRFEKLYATVQDPAVRAATDRALARLWEKSMDASALARACAILHEKRCAVRAERRAYWNKPPGTRERYETDGWKIDAAFNHRFDSLRAAEHLVRRMMTVAQALQCPDALVREAALLALSATPEAMGQAAVRAARLEGR